MKSEIIEHKSHSTSDIYISLPMTYWINEEMKTLLI